MPKYSIIYSDPPWTYNNYNYVQTKSGMRAKRGVTKEYPVMKVEDIMALPVQDLAADDCVLFLWATYPNLQEALDVIDAWGFRYKTLGFTWVKTYAKSGKLFWGMGNWTRSNPELVLMGTRGKPKRVSASVHSVVIAPVGKHSVKPPEVRDRIVQLCGDVPRLEMFARDVAPGRRRSYC